MVSACPHCGKRLRAEKTLVGKQVICPACKQRFTVAEGEHQASKTRHHANKPVDQAQTAVPAPGVGSAATNTPTTAPPSAASGGRSPRRRLLVAAMLSVCLLCAIIVAGAVYWRPEQEDQGPPSVYVVPHIDDIDGDINPDWFFFFDQLRQWHDRNSIPACFAFYPATMGDEQFNRIIADMYASNNIELVLKGEDEYQGRPLDQMSSAEVRRALEDWKGTFTSHLEDLGRSNVQPPVTYNQLMMRLTGATRDAVRDAHFKTYLELGESEYGFIDMLPDLDVTQYSVKLTRSGQAGPDEEFKTPDEVIEELLNFEHDRLLYVDDVKVVPLLCSQRDFRQSEDSMQLDEEKWSTYTALLIRAKKDPRICLLTAHEVYDLRHSTNQAP